MHSITIVDMADKKAWFGTFFGCISVYKQRVAQQFAGFDNSSLAIFDDDKTNNFTPLHMFVW